MALLCGSDGGRPNQLERRVVGLATAVNGLKMARKGVLKSVSPLYGMNLDSQFIEM
jgi:hypothetical protein